MKALIFSAVAALILAAPAMAQDDHHHGGHGGQGGGKPAANAKPPSTPHTAPAVKTPMIAAPASRPAMSQGDNRVRGRINGQPVTVGQVRAAIGAGNAQNTNVPGGNGNGRHKRSNSGNNNSNNGFNNNNGNNNSNFNGGRNGTRNSNGNRNNTHVTINFNRRNVTASHHYRYRGGAYRGPSGYSYRRWTYGQTFPSIYFTQNYWISDYEDYGLAYPPEGTVWVRYGNDAILVDEDTGEILEVVYNQFY